MIGTGFALPIVLAFMAIGQLATQKAWIPGPVYRLRQLLDSGRWACLSMSDWRYWCLIVGEFGLAFICLGWYGCANIKRLERLARPLVYVGNLGLAIALIGLVAAIVKYVIG